MFGNWRQKLQSLSPLASPVVSPTASPKPRRRFHFRTPARMKQRREEFREVQSDPECDYAVSAVRKQQRQRKESSAKMTDRSGSRSGANDSLYDVPPKPRRRTCGFSPNIYSHTLGRLEGRKQVHRLSQYERYFEDLLAATQSEHPDFDELGRVRSKLVSATSNQHSELDRIQDLFPSDHLALHHRDPSYPRMKSLLRKRSAPAYRLQRALSAKSLKHSSSDRALVPVGRDVCDSVAMPVSSASASSHEQSVAETAAAATEPAVKRHFIMEAPVQFTVALQSQERHLFLFNDLLLVAKARSGGNFKLKEKLRVSELWLAQCVDEVSEVTKDSSTSFVLGWPTTNVVVSFLRASARDLWYSKLSQIIADQRLNAQPNSVTIQVVYYDQANNIDFCKTLAVDSSMTARDCVLAATSSLELTPSATSSATATSPATSPAGTAAASSSSSSSSSSSEYQLWVRTRADEAPYPLIGHELPLAIKLNYVREVLGTGESELVASELDQCSKVHQSSCSSSSAAASSASLAAVGGYKCQFILRHVRKSSLLAASHLSVQKKKKSSRKSPIRIHKVFRRANSKSSDCVDSAISRCQTGLLFGQPLSRLCQHEPLPKPILDMLVQLFNVAPFTVGIFRKSANARAIKEMREKLDTELEVNLESVNIFVLACLVKEFMRSLPEPLLGAHLYDEWRHLPEIDCELEKVQRVRQLCARLETANVTLLCHFLCVLHHIAARSSHNLMSSANLSVCVGPSLLSAASLSQAMTAEHSKLIPAVVQFLIDKCALIFGQEVLQLFGPAPEKEVRTDSGAEESDSVNSSGGVRRDDSSIDSLERELLGECEPLPRKDKMSVTNLSRDSGLTMSDSQLYTTADDETEESASNSSGHSAARVSATGRAKIAAARPLTHSVYAGSRDAACHAPLGGARRQLGPTYSSPAVTGSGGAAPSSSRTGATAAKSAAPSAAVAGAGAAGLSSHASCTHLSTGHAGATEPVIYGQLLDEPRRYESNFQRQDWTRQRHQLRRSGHSASSSGRRTRQTGSAALTVSGAAGGSCGSRAMRRSNSEESLLNGYDQCTARRVAVVVPVAMPTVPRSPAASAAAAAAAAGGSELWSPPVMLRSKSAHHIVDRRWSQQLTPASARSSDCSSVSAALRSSLGLGAECASYSRSIPMALDEADRSYDSSTLSDDDSTPQVSRSNSRVKHDSCDSVLADAGCDTWSERYGGGGGAIYATSYGNTGSDSGSHTSRTGSFSTVRSMELAAAAAAATGTAVPPSYEVTLNRRGRLSSSQCQHQHSSCSSLSSAHQLSSRRSSNGGGGGTVRARSAQDTAVDTVDCGGGGGAVAAVTAPPLPPKVDIPPLPPKQKTPLRRVGVQLASDGGSSSSLLSGAGGGSRLRQLPPVHVVTTSWRNRGSVYVRPSAAAAVGRNDDEDASSSQHQQQLLPPALPPKERTVIQIESEYVAPHALTTQVRRDVTRREVHTQTDNNSNNSNNIGQDSCDSAEAQLRESSGAGEGSSYRTEDASGGGSGGAAASDGVAVSVTREPHVTLVEVDTGARLPASRPTDPALSLSATTTPATASAAAAAAAAAAVGPSERRGRNRRRDRQGALRARSHTCLIGSGSGSDLVSSTPSPQPPPPARSDNRLEWTDPLLPNISWSVSKLRAMFAADNNNGANNNNNCHHHQQQQHHLASPVRESDKPWHRPLYRCRDSPLSLEDMLAVTGRHHYRRSATSPRLNNNNSTVSRRRSASGGSDTSSYGEESYV